MLQIFWNLKRSSVGEIISKRNSIAKVFYSLEDEFKVTVRMFYDDKFKDQFSSNAEDRLSSVMNHVQALYDLDSMVTKLHFEVLSIHHLAGVTYNADYNSIQWVLENQITLL